WIEVKKPLEKVGEWTIVHKSPNKRKTTNSNQGCVTIPAQAPFYPNQGYYVPLPIVRQPVGTHLSLTQKTISQFSWSQDPNSAFQASYAKMIKGAENLLKQQQIQEINFFYNTGLPIELYNFINEIWKTHISYQRANFRRALTKFSQFLIEKTIKENKAHDLLLKSILYKDWEELEIEYIYIYIYI
ncbi:hypothetical protein Gotur_012735, partial [Gossypium turneri]